MQMHSVHGCTEKGQLKKLKLQLKLQLRLENGLGLLGT
jgi:hypothetical protein